ncbi:MAG: hypothetical protein WEB29_08595 [Chloroflexota bacterium]
MVGLAIGVMLSGCAVAADNQLEAYLRAAAGAERDRGWHYLNEFARDLGYANDQAAYVADATAADWDYFEWSDAHILWIDDGFAQVRLTLVSAPATVPPLLLQHALLHGICRGEDFSPAGLGAFVDTRLFSAGGLWGAEQPGPLGAATVSSLVTLHSGSNRTPSAVGFVFQDPHLLPGLSTLENVIVAGLRARDAGRSCAKPVRCSTRLASGSGWTFRRPAY